MIADNEFYGPAITDITSRETADDSQNAKVGLNSRHQIGLTYAIADRTALSPMLDFNIVYTRPEKIGKSERNLNWNDCYIKLSRSGLAEGEISGSKFALNGDFRYYLPTAKGSRDTDSHGSIRLTLTPEIRFGKSNFTFSMASYARYYSYRDSSEVPGARAWKFYTSPQLSYSVNDKIMPFVLLEAVDMFDNQGHSVAATDTPPGAPAPSLMDLQPGVEFTLNKHIQLKPFLNWYLNQPVRTTSVNINATLKMF